MKTDHDNQMKLRPIAVDFPLKDRVYEQLKAAITGLDIYAADTQLKLDERSLADRFGISRTPLREAIARLERDGLLQVVPRKGVFIIRKSMDEILEMIVAWAALESMAARLATDVASDEDIASLRQIAAKYNNGVNDTRISEYSDDNIRFHQRIFELSHCALLQDMSNGLFLHMHAVRFRAMREGDRIERSVVDHDEIIAAIEARDANLSARLVREHTMKLHDHVRRTWDQLELLEAKAASN